MTSAAGREPRALDPREVGFGVARGRRRSPYGVVHTHVVRDVSLSITARLLYVLLTTYANQSGIAWPGTDRLNDELGVSDRTRRRAQAELVEAGYLEIVPQFDGRGFQRRSLFVVHDDLEPAARGGTGDPPSATPVDNAAGPGAGDPPLGPGAGDPPSPGAGDHPAPASEHPPKGAAPVTPRTLILNKGECDHGYAVHNLCALCRRAAASA